MQTIDIPYTFYESAPIWLIVVTAIFGLLIGSFLNVVIHRLPLMLLQGWRQECEVLLHPEQVPSETPTLNLFYPSSRCPHCLQNIAWYQNIPVLSFLFLLGRCVKCRTKISWRYPAVEMLCAVLSGYLAWMFGFNLALVGSLLFTWILLALLFIDFKHQLLPDNLTLPLLWIGLFFNLHYTFVSLSSAVVGAMVGYIFFWCVYWIFKLITKKEGMGYGDFKLFAALCAWTGWQYLLMLVLISGILGILIAMLTALIKRQSIRQAMPYGPALAIAGWVTLVWGPNLSGFYWQLVGGNG